MFGKHLRSLRMERKLTQQYMADALKLSLNAYQKYEQEERSPSLECIVKIADIFDVSIDYLLCRDMRKTMNFNERLKSERKAHNFTQQFVADNIGVTLRAYQQYEQGKYEPNIERLIKLADLFHVTVDFLIGRSDQLS